jgi:hypothetical protein
MNGRRVPGCVYPVSEEQFRIRMEQIGWKVLAYAISGDGRKTRALLRRMRAAQVEFRKEHR